MVRKHTESGSKKAPAGAPPKQIYIYIYIYIERERERDITLKAFFEMIDRP